MRRIAITLIMISSLGCSDDEPKIFEFQDDPAITTLNGTWTVISMEDYSSGKVEHPTQENSWEMEITATFDDSHDPHELEGTNTSNAFLGTFEYVGDRQFTVPALASTDAAQPVWADKFIMAITDEDGTFKINSRYLRIYYDNNSRSVTLEKD